MLQKFIVLAKVKSMVCKLFFLTKKCFDSYGFEQLKEEFQINSDQKQIIFGFVGRLDIYTKGRLWWKVLAFSVAILIPNFDYSDSKEKEELQKLIESYRISGKIELWEANSGKKRMI
jgi:hypothetical protein